MFIKTQLVEYKPLLRKEFQHGHPLPCLQPSLFKDTVSFCGQSSGLSPEEKAFYETLVKISPNAVEQSKKSKDYFQKGEYYKALHHLKVSLHESGLEDKIEAAVEYPEGSEDELWSKQITFAFARSEQNLSKQLSLYKSALQEMEALYPTRPENIQMAENISLVDRFQTDMSTIWQKSRQIKVPKEVITQINGFNKAFEKSISETGNVLRFKEPFKDGFRFYDKRQSLQLDKNGVPQFSDTSTDPKNLDSPIFVVDKQKDKALEKKITRFQKYVDKTQKTSPKEVGKLLLKFLNDTLKPTYEYTIKYMDEDDEEQEETLDYNVVKAHHMPHREILLGELFSGGVGVEAGRTTCNGNALLAHVIGREAGLKTSYLASNTQGHAWTELTDSTDKPLILDPYNGVLIDQAEKKIYFYTPENPKSFTIIKSPQKYEQLIQTYIDNNGNRVY